MVYIFTAHFSICYIINLSITLLNYRYVLFQFIKSYVKMKKIINLLLKKFRTFCTLDQVCLLSGQPMLCVYFNGNTA